MKNAVKTGLFDIDGKELLVGNIVRSDRGYEGKIMFGTYANEHYGVYIEWLKTPGVDKSYLRQNILFWVNRIHAIG